MRGSSATRTYVDVWVPQSVLDDNALNDQAHLWLDVRPGIDVAISGVYEPYVHYDSKEVARVVEILSLGATAASDVRVTVTLPAVLSCTPPACRTARARSPGRPFHAGSAACSQQQLRIMCTLSALAPEMQFLYACDW